MTTPNLETKLVGLNILNGKVPIWTHKLVSPYRFEVDAGAIVLARGSAAAKSPDVLVFLVGQNIDMATNKQI